jgi:hypothetical protein
VGSSREQIGTGRGEPLPSGPGYRCWCRTTRQPILGFTLDLIEWMARRKQNNAFPSKRPRPGFAAGVKASVFGAAVTMTADTSGRIASNTGAASAANALSVVRASARSVTTRL